MLWFLTEIFPLSGFHVMLASILPSKYDNVLNHPPDQFPHPRRIVI